MYPSGQMSSSDPRASGNHGGGYTMPCCSHGYNYGYFYPPGPMTPYQHVYPSPQPYAAAPPVLPPYHHPHVHSMPGTPVNSYFPPDVCLPFQHQQQYPVWGPPMVMPQSNCCCACPNHYSYPGSPVSSSLTSNTKVSNEPDPEDAKILEGVKPVVWNNASNSSQPHLVWIPPQYVNSLQKQDEDKGFQDRKTVGQWIPFDFDKLASLYNKDTSKPTTAGAEKDFPFPFILMPHTYDSSKGNPAKNRISEIEEKPSICNNTQPLKLLDGDVERTRPPEPVKIIQPHDDPINRGVQTQNEKSRVKDIPVKRVDTSNSSKGSPTKNRISEIEEKPSICNNTQPLKQLGGDVERIRPPESVKMIQPHDDPINRGVQTQNEKVRVKDIPVKQAGESIETKPSTNAAVKSQSPAISPTKTSKLPPVCLRIDPLPRKKNGNVTSKPRSLSEGTNAKKKEEGEGKMHHHDTDKAKDVKVIETSSKESPKDNPVFPFDADGKVKDGRENAERELMESVKQSTQPAPVRLEKGPAHDPKARKSISEETAAVRIQSAYRGYDERKWQPLQKLRQIAKVREQISSIKDRIQTLEDGADMNKEEFERQRLIIGETIMSLLLTLDTIQGLHPSIRDIRKSVARELTCLQEKLDLFHAQRFRESEHGMDHGKGESADNIDVNEVPSTNETEKEDTYDMLNASNDYENMPEESDSEKTNVNDGNAGKEENLNKITDSACAEQHQEEIHDEYAHTEQTQEQQQEGAHDECIHITQDTTQSVATALQEGKSQPNCSIADEADSTVKSTAHEVEGSDKENTEDGTLDEQPLEGGGNNCSLADDVSEREPTVNSVVVPVDLQTVETTQTGLEGEKLNPISCGTTVENGEVLSEELSMDGLQIYSANEHDVEDCGETLERMRSHMEKQPEHQDLGSDSSERETNATYAACALAEVPPEMEEENEEADSYKPGEGAEMDVCEQDSKIQHTDQGSQEELALCESARNLNPSISGLSSGKAASAADEYDKRSNDSKSEEETVITDNCSGAGIEKAEKIDFKLCDERIKKSEAQYEDFNSLPDNDGASIDEHEPSRLSNVSQASTENADSIVLAEENDKLRETVRKLLESEKVQLAVISSLNGRLRNLEKKLKKKRNRKMKLQSGVSITSARKNNEECNQNIPISSM